MLHARPICAVVTAVLLSASMATPAVAASEERSLEELRNTVVNLLQALVEQKVITAEQANRMVQQAQDKTAKTMAVAEAKDVGAVRVGYVPQIVKDEIAQQVASTLRGEVAGDVVKTAKTEGWGVPGALPDWLRQVRAIGDVRVRFQQDRFGSDNIAFTIPDYQSINAAGGFTQAGLNAFLNSTHDTERLRLRARFGLQATLSESWSAAVRLSTGGALDPSSESQTFGATAARYGVGLDQAYVRFEPRTKDGYAYTTITAGRIPSPWYAPSELIYARDLSFEGVAATGRLHWGATHDGGPSSFYATVGGFPIQQVPLDHSGNKWLLAGQLGANAWLSGSDRFNLAAAYYDFVRVSGVQNPVGLALYNYTAPPFIRYGNTYFDIANSLTGTNNLFALAAKFVLINVSAGYEHNFGTRTLSVSADAVRNIGYGRAEIKARTGIDQDVRNRGYVFEAGFGDRDPANRLGGWRVSAGYRYVQRDAVLDAWTDSDFRLGGTNTRGPFVVADFGLSPQIWLRAKYMNADIIDGVAPYSVDSLQVDLNARF
jgi:hypothetical protein